MTRTEWLDQLLAGDPVSLVTPCGIHKAAIEGFKDGRLWVIWSLGQGCEFGHSATWVDPKTGDNVRHSYRIEPCEIRRREAVND